MSILINLPDYKHLYGGVVSFYKGLAPYWSKSVKYNRVGKRRQGYPGVLWLPADIIRFLKEIIANRPEGIVLNPSFNKSAWVRDQIFIRIARTFHIPLIVVFHGWSESYVDSISSQGLAQQFSGVGRVLVLANRFKNQLEKKSVAAEIDFFSTHVSDDILEATEVMPRDRVPRRFLFLSRLEKTKGIYEAISLFNLIRKEYPDSVLTIAGDGSEREKIKSYIADRSIDSIKFVGFVEGKEKAELLATSDFFLFPTSYNEGLPGALIEAMAFGLPVLTRSVGGIPDFFIDGEMGILEDSLDPEKMLERIRPFLTDAELQQRVSANNIRYATEHFKASKVASRLEAIFSETFPLSH